MSLNKSDWNSYVYTQLKQCLGGNFNIRFRIFIVCVVVAPGAFSQAWIKVSHGSDFVTLCILGGRVDGVKCFV
jgi:hypothetical protein